MANQPSPRTVASMAFVTCVVVALGCGPIEYFGQVTRRASTEVERAREVRADKLAPYEYTLAVEYLHKAREEASYSDYQAAVRFGRRAEKAASEAVRLAEARAADPERASKELPPRGVELERDVAPLEDPTGDPAPADPTGTEEVPEGLSGDEP